MSDDTPKTVVQALAAVMAELPAIGKGDKSPEGYTYRGVEPITKQLQPLLAKHGVVIVPRAEILATVPSPAMKDGWRALSARGLPPLLSCDAGGAGKRMKCISSAASRATAASAT